MSSADAPHGAADAGFIAPHPGSRRMPRWTTGELISPPRVTGRTLLLLIGPGLVMGASAIGGGEWLMGPVVTAKYGGALMWLATLSILAQGLYNVEISRYTLYTGEPIFTGKFRTLPGPWFWLVLYLFLDFGSIFPYLAANAATPVVVVLLGGELPDPDHVSRHWWMVKIISSMIFLLAMVPLIFGGKVYNSLKAVMSFKLVMVVGFLLFLAVFYSHSSTWIEIFSGFVKFGNVPVERGEDLNGNGVLDEGEDWDGDGRLDVVEPMLGDISDAARSGEWPDFNGDGQPDGPVDTDGNGRADSWGDLDGDGQPEQLVDDNQDGQPDQWPDLIKDADGNTDGSPDIYIDTNRDGLRDGSSIENVFVSLFTKGEFPRIDFTYIALIAALAAIAGNGGLTNTPISNFTRDQGWGMGHLVGAIPSMVGGRGITLSHVGSVFQVTQDSLVRWKGWYRHVLRDQLCMWVPACFIGVALPSMLSVEFLPRGTDAGNWNAAAMTADYVGNEVANPRDDVLMSTTGLSTYISGEGWGNLFWALTLLCGFLVLAPSMVTTIDGIIRRWVDVFWTASPRLRGMDPAFIKHVYFRVLVVYGTFGFIMLWLQTPSGLIKIATLGYNFALGFSCMHTAAINSILLPKELRPRWFVVLGLVLAGSFFATLGTVATLNELGLI